MSRSTSSYHQPRRLHVTVEFGWPVATPLHWLSIPSHSTFPAALLTMAILTTGLRVKLSWLDRRSNSTTRSSRGSRGWVGVGRGPRLGLGLGAANPNPKP